MPLSRYIIAVAALLCSTSVAAASAPSKPGLNTSASACRGDSVQVQYTLLASGLTLTWDAPARTFKLVLHGPSARALFRAPAHPLKSSSSPSAVTSGMHYISTHQLSLNLAKCNSSLGQGVIMVQPQPGFEASFPGDIASVASFEASRMKTSKCGDKLTLWGWLPEATGLSDPSLMATFHLNTSNAINRKLLDIPSGMRVLLTIEGSLDARNATTAGIDTDFHPPASCSKTARRALSAQSDCSAAFSSFSGGAPSALETGKNIAFKALSFVEGIAEVVDLFDDVLGFVLPSESSRLSGQLVYDCISSLVQEAIDAAISNFYLSTVKSDINNIIKLYQNFKSTVATLMPQPRSKAAEADISKAFDNIGNLITPVANALSNQPFDPPGVLSTFVTFTTAQYFPYFIAKYLHYDDIYFTKAKDTVKNKELVLDLNLVQMLPQFQNFVSATVAQMITDRTDKVGDLMWSHDCPYYGDCDYYNKFTDSDTGITYECHQKAASGSSHGDFNQRSAAFRDVIIDRAEASMRINAYQTTSNAETWPALIPGSNKAMQYSTTVVQTKCFSYSPSCDLHDGSRSAMPAGHDYQDYNISKIRIHGGDWIDYIKVTYTSKSGKRELTQEFGNSAWGPSKVELTDLLTNPIVKASWHANQFDSSRNIFEEFGAGFLGGIELTQSNGKLTSWGTTTSDKKRYQTDDYWTWSGNVRLCGMVMFGDVNRRVEGLGPAWCYLQGQAVDAKKGRLQ